jgi:hypothetical protein
MLSVRLQVGIAKGFLRVDSGSASRRKILENEGVSATVIAAALRK